MSTIQSLRTFVNERLTAAAEEILGVFVKTIVVYEEEIDRQRRLLDVVRPEIKINRTATPQPSVIKEEVLLDQQHCNQQTNFSLSQEEPEPPQIKEEQEELCTSQEGEQPLLWEEADIFKLTPAYDGSDHSEHLHSDPYQTQSVAEKESLINISSESDREGSAVSEPDSDHQLLSHNWHVAESQVYNTSSCENMGSTTSTELTPNKRLYKCNSCSKEFPCMSTLKIHLRTHTGEKPFRCDICGKRLSRAETLKTHMRVHTGEKPYSCVYCGKAFADGSAHARHLRVHTGEKPYKCLLCGKRFTVSSNLNVHTRTHHTEAPH